MAIVLDGDNLTSTGVPNTRTAQNSTSGTSIDFTSIPAGTKRITVMLNGISKSGTSTFLIQLGTGGVPTTSGYTVTASYISSTLGAATALTTGFGTIGDGIATATVSGNLVVTNLSGNIWTGSAVLVSPTPTNLTMQIAGIVTLGGALNFVRVTTANGTDTFDAGSINILYE